MFVAPIPAAYGRVVDNARYGPASQLAVLRSCPDIISRVLKTGGSLLLASKVLVISRLLHTKLSQQPKQVPYLDKLRNRLASLRRRLLSSIERKLKTLDLSREQLVECLCSYSLATSSSSKDVLRHFHHIRLEAISESAEVRNDGHDGTLTALRVYVRTLKDTQDIVPVQLFHALEKLKSTPILGNQEVSSIMELNLDVHKRWIGDDIKTFTPYIKHDDLTRADARSLLKRWAKQAFQSFLDNLRDKVLDVQDPLELVKLRREVIELWLSNHQHSIGVDSAETLNGLRDVFNLQSAQIVRSRALMLGSVSLTIQDILHNWQPGISDMALSLWDSSLISNGMSSGSKSVRDRLANLIVGKNEPLNKVSSQYVSWLKSVDGVDNMITKIRETKWVDDIDDMDDEEDDLLDNKQVLLSEDDPTLLQKGLESALHEAFTNLEVRLQNLSEGLDEANCGLKAVFLVRVWRELRQHLPRSYQNHKLGFDSIPKLLGTLAETTLRRPMERCSKRIGKMANNRRLLLTQLWEGDPPLPISPSAWAFGFLKDLVSSMTTYGSDIWSPVATDALKRELIPKIASLLERQAITDVQTNGHTNGENGYLENGALAGNEVKGTEGMSGRELEGDNHHGDKVPAENDASNQRSAGPEAEYRTESQGKKHINGAHVNGGAGPERELESKEAMIQKSFDIFYLLHATAVKKQSLEDDELLKVQQSLAGKVGLEAEFVERMKKDAGEYWKRTSLLFALLG